MSDRPDPEKSEHRKARVLTWGRRGAPLYRGAFQQIFEGMGDRLSLLEREQAERGHLAGALARLAPARWRILIRNSPRFHRLTVCDLLIDRGLAVVDEEPETARDLAQAAVEMAEGLTRQGIWGSLAWDTLARAWACLGNAERAAGEHGQAEAAFSKAELCLEKGTGDPFEEARLLRLRATWARDRGHLEDAEDLLHREASLYDHPAQAAQAARALVERATVRRLRGDLPGALLLCWCGLKNSRKEDGWSQIHSTWKRLSTEVQG